MPPLAEFREHVPAIVLDSYGLAEGFKGLEWTSIYPRSGRDIFHVIRQCKRVNWPIIEPNIPTRVHSRERVFHPSFVVPIREVFSRMGAAAFGTRNC